MHSENAKSKLSLPFAPALAASGQDDPWFFYAETPSETSSAPESVVEDLPVLSCGALMRLPFFRKNMDSIYTEALEEAVSLHALQKQAYIDEFEFQVRYKTEFG